MTHRGDHEPAMPATPLLDDEAIDAIMTGHAAADVAGPLAAFVDLVQAEGRAAPPPPSPILARLLAEGAAAAGGDAPGVLLPGDDPPTAGPADAAVWGRGHDATGATTRLNGRATAATPVIADVTGRLPASAAGRSGPGRRRHLMARVAGAGLAAKVALGAGAAAAGVLGAGVLPGPAGRVARDAIEAVTPMQFPRDDHPADNRGSTDSDGTGADDPGEHGDRVSPDATGQSDGQPGVDGPQVAETAPGADERPGDIPATTDPARTPSSTVPPSAPGRPSDPGAPADPGPPPSIPSTIPAPPTTKTAGDARDGGGTTQTTP